MQYTIYQITNQIDLKIYIGKHQTLDLNDGYMGSGKYLLRAIKKHGIENFQKEILFVFDNENDMNAKEASLVTAEFILLETNYNLSIGGNGGFSYINSTLPPGMLGKTQSDIQKLAAHNYMMIMHNNKEWHYRISSKGGSNSTGFSGKSHSYESKEKMRGPRPNTTGDRNSQAGSCWITDGTVNTKLKKNDTMPQGWYLGRTYKRKQL
jgi:hypothetical protein